MAADKRLSFAVPLIFLGLAVFYTLPFLLHLHNWGIRDWDRSFVMAGIPGDAIFRYGQFPFWNPYLGGGNIFFHHPEVAVFSPFTLLYFVFGEVVGLKLQLLICYFIGFWGSYRFAKANGLSIPSAVMASLAYFGSVFFALHFAEGHVVFGDFCLLPWFLVCVMESATRRSRLLWAAVIIAAMILGNGGGAALMYTMLFSGFFFVLRSIDNRSIQPLLHAGIGFAGGIALSAIKFLPMMVHFVTGAYPRGSFEEHVSLSSLYKIFFGLEQSVAAKLFPEQVWSWTEYGAYISPLLFALAGIAVALRFRTVWCWLVLLFIFLTFGLGNFSHFSPWSLLTQLPGFHDARCASRCFQCVILAVAILGGIGFDLVIDALKKQKNLLWSKLVWVIPFCVVATNMILVWPILTSAFPYTPRTATYAPVFTNVMNDTTNVYLNFKQNRGSLVSFVTFYESLRALIDYRDTSIVSEAILSGSAQILHRTFTPNRIEYELDAKRAGTFAVSQGYDLGWRITDGRPISNFQDVMSFPFSAGHQTITMRYVPPYFYAGLAISLASLALLVFLAARFARSI